MQTDDHFVETNIIIGYTVEWDRQVSTVEEYLDGISDVELRTSIRVLDEAEKVVNERRRVTKQAANKIFQDFDAGRGRPQVDEIVDFVYKELSHYRDAVVDHVIQHIKDNENYYIGLTQVTSRRGLASTTGDIDDDFDDPLDLISAIRRERCTDFQCSIFQDTESDYRNYAVYNTVARTLSGSPNDRDILLDAYHLTKVKSLQLLYFVTMDRDLTDNESTLESRLGTVDIEHPSSL